MGRSSPAGRRGALIAPCSPTVVAASSFTASSASGCVRTPSRQRRHVRRAADAHGRARHPPAEIVSPLPDPPARDASATVTEADLDPRASAGSIPRLRVQGRLGCPRAERRARRHVRRGPDLRVADPQRRQPARALRRFFELELRLSCCRRVRSGPRPRPTRRRWSCRPGMADAVEDAVRPRLWVHASVRDAATARTDVDHADGEPPHPQPHDYIAYVGVAPEGQGQGLGTRLLRPTLDRCDTEGLPTYLEATSERNRALYARLGFQVQGELRLGSSPSLWLMRQPPASPAR